MLLRLLSFILLGLIALEPAWAQKRLALLIGNQDYKLDRLDLRNPHKDVEIVGRSLEQIGFKVRIVKDAGLGLLQLEINRYTALLQRAGDDAIGFFYYSGHGALNDRNRYNYLIPVDVQSDADSELWNGSIRLQRVIRDLREQAGNAIQFVVFDACRNELRLASSRTKSLRQTKGFRPVRRVKGMLIAYATAEGETASDFGKDAGPYAKSLARWLVKPGLEAVSVFREVQVSVFNSIGQEPWYTHGAIGRVYLAGKQSEQTGRKQLLHQNSVALAWSHVAKSTDVEVLRGFISQFGEDSPVYRRLARNRIRFLLESQRKEQQSATAVSQKKNDDHQRLASHDKQRQKPVATPKQTSCVGVELTTTNGRRVCIKPGSGRAFRDCPGCPEMVIVPPGRYNMGSPSSELGRHKTERLRAIEIPKPFAIGRYEISRAEFKAFVQETGAPTSNKCVTYEQGRWRTRTARNYISPGYPTSDRHPAVCVDWNDAVQFAEWLSQKTNRNYRLPTEAEWEYVARAGTQSRYFFGQSADELCRYANGLDKTSAKINPKWTFAPCHDDYFRAAPVGTFSANGFGLYDAVGNVWEWVADCWRGGRNSGNCERVVRGGSAENSPKYLRSASRIKFPQSYNYYLVGFRLVADL